MSDAKRNYTTSSSSTATATLTWFTTRNEHYAVGGWWGILDSIAHRLPLPKQVQRIICDRYEVAVGIPRQDLVAMDYKGVTPWWLKR